MFQLESCLVFHVAGDSPPSLLIFEDETMKFNTDSLGKKPSDSKVVRWWRYAAWPRSNCQHLTASEWKPLNIGPKMPQKERRKLFQNSLKNSGLVIVIWCNLPRLSELHCLKLTFSLLKIGRDPKGNFMFQACIFSGANLMLVSGRGKTKGAWRLTGMNS